MQLLFILITVCAKRSLCVQSDHCLCNVFTACDHCVCPTLTNTCSNPRRTGLRQLVEQTIGTRGHGAANLSDIIGQSS